MKGLKIKKKSTLMILVVAGVALFVAILVIISSLLPQKEVITSVEVVKVENGDVTEQLDTTGTVTSMQIKTFFSPVNATIDSMNFETGDVVRAGEQLIDFDLTDLEKENQKAELNVLSGEYDYQDTVNQSKKQDAKKSSAQSQVGSLQSQVNEWQDYVTALQAQINQANTDAQNQAQTDASAAATSAAAQYQTDLSSYNTMINELYSTVQEKLTIYNQCQTEYEIALAVWTDDKTDSNKKKLKTASENQSTAESNYDAAAEKYDQAKDDKPNLADYTSSGGIDASADTAALQRELELANTELSKLQSELATQESIADSDGGTLTSEMNAKLLISSNLTELEAKTIEELIEEGKKGVQAEFTGVISDSKVVSGTTVSQGLEMFTLQSTEDVSVEVSVSKNDYDKVQIGQKAVIKMSNKEYDGTVTKINRIAIANDKGTPMIGVTVHIDNPDDNIFIGVEAKVTIKAAEANNVPIVPVEVVNIGNEGSFCYVIAEGKIEKRNVETGISTDSYTEISSGLEAGDEIIPDIGSFSEGDAVTGVETAGEDNG